MDLFRYFVIFLVLETDGAKFYSQPKICYEGSATVGNFYHVTNNGEDKYNIGTADQVVIFVDNGTKKASAPDYAGRATYRVDCCGEVKEWLLDPTLKDSKGGTVKMQFWEDLGNDKWRLVVEQPYTFSTQKSYHFPITNIQPVNPIPVRMGYHLGFAGNLLEFKQSTTYDDKLAGTVLKSNIVNPVVDSTYTFTTEIAEAQGTAMMSFAIGALLKPSSSSIACKVNLINTAIDDITAVGTAIGSVILDGSGDPNGYYKSLHKTDGLKSIDIDENTGLITVTKTLSVPAGGKSYNLTGRLIDKECFTYGECTTKLTINWTNKPITLKSPNAHTTVVESKIAPSILHTVETVDENRLERLDRFPNCSITEVRPPNGGGFSMQPYNLVSTKFNIQYDGTPALNPTNTPVLLVYKCWDEHGSTVTGTFTVNVTPNEAPTIPNQIDPKDGCIKNSTDARNTRKGDEILSFLPEDKELDTITSKFIKKNSSSPFDYNTKYNFIYATQDLETLLQANHKFTLQLWDKWNKNKPSEYEICILVEGLNTVPVFSKCPTMIPLTENKDVGDLVVVLGATDSNKDRDKQIHTYTMTVTPSQFQNSYILEPNSGEIRISGNGDANDFEKADPVLKGGCINFVVRLTDGIHYSAKDCEFCVKIKNINDPPIYALERQTLQITERATGPLPSLDMNFTDEDVGDVHTMKIIGGNSDGYFSIDATTGQLSLTKECDYEAGCSSQFDLTIQVTDREGLADTMAVTVHVADANDNSPTFSSIKCSIAVNETTSTAQTLAVVTATDPDSESNGEFDYYIAGSGFGIEYFNVDKTGAVKLRKAVDLNDGTEFKITIRASDRGTPQRHGYINCDVIISKQILTTTTAANEQPCFFCTEGGVAIFTMLMVALVLLLAFLLYLMYLHLCYEAVNRCLWRMTLRRKPHLLERPKKTKQKQRSTRRMPSPPPSPPSPRSEPEVYRFRRIQTPPEPAQSSKFNFWNQRDTELHNNNPHPSGTFGFI